MLRELTSFFITNSLACGLRIVGVLLSEDVELVLRFLGLISNCVLLRRWNPGDDDDDLSFFSFCTKDLWRCIAADDRLLVFGENFLGDDDFGGEPPLGVICI